MVDDIDAAFRAIVEKMKQGNLGDLSEEDLETITERFERQRAERKAAERPYAIAGLDVPWFVPEPARPVKVWQPIEGYYAAIAPSPLQPGFNGYVLLPPGHPWRDKELQWDDAEQVEVHGGITFGPHVTGWIGFDTAHAWDHWHPDEVIQLEVPEAILRRWRDLAQTYAEIGLDQPHPVSGWDKWWTVQDLINETNNLAQQAKDAEGGSNDD